MRHVLYSRKHTKKREHFLADRSSDTVWAALTILSLPVVAMSLNAIGFQPLYSFLLGCAATFVIVAIEAFTRGTVWIFRDKYAKVFGYEQTSFRIMLVTAGILLILQTFLIIQLLVNPNIDSLVLNVVAHKQCLHPQTHLADILCPLFDGSTPQVNVEFPLLVSLESAAKTRLMPNDMMATCAAVPLGHLPTPADQISLRFFVSCQPWSTNSQGEQTVTKIISADLTRDQSGFFIPQTWQDEGASEEYTTLTNNQSFMQYVHDQLSQRHTSILRPYLTP